MWKRLRLWAGRSYTVHVSQAYKSAGSTAALYTFSLVFSLMPFLSHTDVHRRPTVELALAIRLSTSESMFTVVSTVLLVYENRQQFSGSLR